MALCSEGDFPCRPADGATETQQTPWWRHCNSVWTCCECLLLISRLAWETHALVFVCMRDCVSLRHFGLDTPRRRRTAPTSLDVQYEQTQRSHVMCVRCVFCLSALVVWPLRLCSDRGDLGWLVEDNKPTSMWKPSELSCLFVCVVFVCFILMGVGGWLSHRFLCFWPNFTWWPRDCSSWQLKTAFYVYKALCLFGHVK